jgi:hypothetical protein
MQTIYHFSSGQQVCNIPAYWSMIKNDERIRVREAKL